MPATQGARTHGRQRGGPSSTGVVAIFNTPLPPAIAPPPHLHIVSPIRRHMLSVWRSGCLPFDGRTSRSTPHTSSTGSPTPSAVNPCCPTPCSALSAGGTPRRPAPHSPLAEAWRLPALSQARLVAALPLLPPHA